MSFGPDGLPQFDKNGGLWIRLTVAGVTRVGYGDAAGKSGPNAIKEAIGDAIRKVEQKVVGREFVAKQIAQAEKIARSTESTKQKVADLTAIQKTLAGRSMHAIEIVQAKIDAAKRAQVAAQQKTTDAGWGTARAIQEKDLSVTVPVNLSIRDIYNGQKKISRVFATPS